MIIRSLDFVRDLTELIQGQNLHFARRLTAENLQRFLHYPVSGGLGGFALEESGRLQGAIMYVDLAANYFGRRVALRQAGNVFIAPEFRRQGWGMKLIMSVDALTSQREIYCGLFIAGWTNIKEQDSRGEYKLIPINRYQYWLNPVKQSILAVSLKARRLMAKRREEFNGLDPAEKGFCEPAGRISLVKNSSYLNWKYAAESYGSKMAIYLMADKQGDFGFAVINYSGASAVLADFRFKPGRQRDFMDLVSRVAFRRGCSYLDCSLVSAAFERWLISYGFKQVASDQFLDVRRSDELGPELFCRDNWHIVSGDAI